MANYQIHELTSGTIDRDSNVIHDTLNGGNYETRKATAGAVADLANVNVATLYDSATTYAIGQYCLYEGDIYRCIAITTGAFDSTAWTQIVVTGEFRRVVELTSAQYTALSSAEKNNGTLYIITDEETTAADIPYSADVSVADKLAEVSVSYDLTEKVVGVWQDGKPLYEKTINWNGTISTGTQVINTNITNPKFVFFDTVILNDNSLNTLCFPYISTNANVNGYITADGTKVHIDVGTYWNTHKLYFAFKLRYTKTTD